MCVHIRAGKLGGWGGVFLLKGLVQPAAGNDFQGFLFVFLPLVVIDFWTADLNVMLS